MTNGAYSFIILELYGTINIFI